MSCSPLIAPDNGMTNCTGSLFEDTCTYLCDDGYILWGSANVSCQSDGTWSGSNITVCTQGEFNLVLA